MNSSKYFRLLNLIGFTLAVVLASCSHYYYTPSAHNVPLFHQKNEYQITVTSGGNDVVETAGIQLQRILQ